MENNSYFNDMISSYLNGELNAEEETFILNWINSSPENKQYFEELKKIWYLLSVEKIDVDAEWKQFKQAVDPEPKAFYKTEQEKVDAELVEKGATTPGRIIRRLALISAVAALLCIIVFVALQPDNKRGARQELSAINADRKLLVNGPFLQHQVNQAGNNKKLVLQDGSEVRLYNESKIDFYEPFINNQRNIVLSGKADFKVAKDRTKPFTVVSGDISTTALGTQFTVTAVKDAKSITVRLYEGKVLVKLNKVSKSNPLNQFILLPGQELTYDNKKLAAEVRTFKKAAVLTEKNKNDKDSILIDNPSVPSSNKGSWYMFNNQSLDQVFTQLEDMYAVDIVFKKKDISKLYFIGTFNATDSLDTILEQIAGLNNLKVIKEKNRFIIKK